MDKFKMMSSVLAKDNIGIYPQARIDADGTRHERTAWQEGWNACSIKISRNTSKISEWLKTLSERIIELIENDTLRVSIESDKNPSLWILCNDLFFWACADGEDFELSDLPDLEKALLDSPTHGDLLWCCRKRKMRPQKPYYKYIKKEEHKLFNQCGPKRDE